MQTSILIVSKNRKEELERTLIILFRLIDVSQDEVLVFLDGCTDGSGLLKENFTWVRWYSIDKSIGASAARNQLYKQAKGQLLIGLDDDAHPLSRDFIDQTNTVFKRYPNAGIVAFEEIKGIFNSDQEALVASEQQQREYYSNEFIGCGFAVLKSVYDQTNGFPVWVDIYGEEACVSIEVIAKGYDIVYSNAIKVNHRVNIQQRKAEGANYFRFGRQLKNTTYYYLVYYPFPIYKIMRLYLHNFRKYVLMDRHYFTVFFTTLFKVIVNCRAVLKYRSPISNEVVLKMKNLSALKF